MKRDTAVPWPILLRCLVGLMLIPRITVAAPDPLKEFCTKCEKDRRPACEQECRGKQSASCTQKCIKVKCVRDCSPPPVADEGALIEYKGNRVIVRPEKKSRPPLGNTGRFH